MTHNILSAAPRFTVLIVDDIPANLGVAVEHLETRGYRVVIAQEGEEGLQRAVFVQPDIILLDVMLPGQDGFEICRRLKTNADTRNIPVIFMTALLEEDDKLAGFEAGGVDYITKPLHIGELLVRVDTHLKLSLMQKQLEVQNRQLQQHRQELEQQVTERTVELSSSNRSLEAEIGVRQSAEAALQESERQYRSLVENTQDTIARYDRDCLRLYANPKMIEELGGEIERILNHTPTEFPGGDSAVDYEERIRQTFADAQPTEFELSWQSAEGRQIVSYISLTPEFSADGGVVSVLAVGRDITEIDQYRCSIHRLAFYDALTNLPNRALLVERMQQTISDASLHGYRFALMLLDLDRFKNINDALGHDMGDLLLSAAAERLQHCMRTCGMVARLGGMNLRFCCRYWEQIPTRCQSQTKLLKSLSNPSMFPTGSCLFPPASASLCIRMTVPTSTPCSGMPIRRCTMPRSWDGIIFSFISRSSLHIPPNAWRWKRRCAMRAVMRSWNCITSRKSIWSAVK